MNLVSNIKDLRESLKQEQMDFFNEVNTILSTMGRINAYAKAYGYDTITIGMGDLKVMFGLSSLTWGTSKIDNELVVMSDWDSTFGTADLELTTELDRLAASSVSGIM